MAKKHHTEKVSWKALGGDLGLNIVHKGLRDRFSGDALGSCQGDQRKASEASGASIWVPHFHTWIGVDS